MTVGSFKFPPIVEAAILTCRKYIGQRESEYQTFESFSAVTPGSI